MPSADAESRIEGHSTAEFLPQHRAHRGQVIELITAAEARGQTRLVEMNQQVLGNLDRIIDTLDEAPRPASRSPMRADNTHHLTEAARRPAWRSPRSTTSCTPRSPTTGPAAPTTTSPACSTPRSRNRPVRDDEIAGTLASLAVAGPETTMNSASTLAYLLASDPDFQNRIRATPERASDYVEEMLRLRSPAQNFARRTTRDVEIDGVIIPAGSGVLLSYAAANRDPRRFAAPDRSTSGRPAASTSRSDGVSTSASAQPSRGVS